MEATGCSKIVAPIYKTTRCHILESYNLYSCHKANSCCAGCETLTAVAMKNSALWDIPPHNPKKNTRLSAVYPSRNLHSYYLSEYKVSMKSAEYYWRAKIRVYLSSNYGFSLFILRKERCNAVKDLRVPSGRHIRTPGGWQSSSRL
jgi:hypothetical protein